MTYRSCRFLVRVFTVLYITALCAFAPTLAFAMHNPFFWGPAFLLLLTAALARCGVYVNRSCMRQRYREAQRAYTRSLRP